MAGNINNKIYEGNQITIDLENNRCKREIDGKWIRFDRPKYIAITQVRMNQTGGGLNGPFLTTKYQAFCVYIKSGKLNILAYRGRRDYVMEEAERIAGFLNVKVVDMLPRNAEGEVIDDDHPEKLGILNYGCVVIMLAILLFITILYFVNSS